MKTIEEVKEYFKDAKKVKSQVGNIFDYTKSIHVHKYRDDIYCKDKDGKDRCLYNGKYAKILTYKTKQMKPKKEETKALYQLAKEAIEAPTSEVCQQWKDKILDACPSLKKEDVPIIGEWYKSANCIFNYQKHKSCYGFRFSVWIDCSWTWDDFRGIEKADPKEVESMLIKEAVKRGFKDGGYYEDVDNPHCTSKRLYFNHLYYTKSENWLGDGHGSVIFKHGTWSKVTNTITRAEAEKQLNAKIVD